jgi:hypothetical protein
MTNEEIARNATGQITDGGFAWWQSNKVELIYATILAAINRSQSEDKARLDWLETQMRRPRKDGIEPFMYWLGEEYKRGPFREAIDAARKNLK